MEANDETDEPAGDVAESPADFCEYQACLDWAKRDGLCMKHLVAAAKGDEAAVAVKERRKRLAAIKAEAVRPPANPWATSHKGAGGTPAPQQQENPMGDKVKCEKCGREFEVQGIGPHRARCKGPAAPVELCGVDGCIRKAGHDGKHYGRKKNGVSVTAEAGATGSSGRAKAGTLAAMKRAKTERPKTEDRRLKAEDGRATSITIAADAPAAIANRTRELAEALGVVELPGANPDAITLMNPVNGKVAVVGFDGTTRRGLMTFQEFVPA